MTRADDIHGYTFTPRQELADGYGPSQQRRIALTDAASRLRIVKVTVVPGILQTAGCARTVLAGNNPGLD